MGPRPRPVERTYYQYRENDGGRLAIAQIRVVVGPKRMTRIDGSIAERWTEEQLLRNGWRDRESIALAVFIVRQRDRVERLKIDLREADRALLEAQALQEQGGLLAAGARS